MARPANLDPAIFVRNDGSIDLDAVVMWPHGSLPEVLSCRKAGCGHIDQDTYHRYWQAEMERRARTRRLDLTA